MTREQLAAVKSNAERATRLCNEIDALRAARAQDLSRFATKATESHDLPMLGIDAPELTAVLKAGIDVLIAKREAELEGVPVLMEGKPDCSCTTPAGSLHSSECPVKPCGPLTAAEWTGNAATLRNCKAAEECANQARQTLAAFTPKGFEQLLEEHESIAAKLECEASA